MASSLLALVLILPSHPSDAAVDLAVAGQAHRRIDLQANTFTSSAQEAVAIGEDALGRAVVVWQSKRQEDPTYGIRARRFAADGSALTEEIAVNATVEGPQTRPALAVAPSGATWFAWESMFQDGDEGAIVARRFDASLARSSAEVLVNAGATAGHQADPAVACDAHGNAVIVWAAPGATPDERRVFARRFDGEARALGDAFRVGTADGVRDGVPCVELDAAGGFAVVWARASLGGKPQAILGRRFDAQGAPIGGEIEISGRDGRQHVEPSLALSPSGDMAVAWFTARGEDYGITLRSIRIGRTPEGVEALEPGPELSIETGTPGYASGLAIARGPDRRLLLAWSGFGDEKGESDLFARMLDADGAHVSDVFRVAASPAGHQKLWPASGARHLLYSDDGRMSFAWSGNAGKGDKSAACLTRIAPADLDLAALSKRAMPVEEQPRFEAAEAARRAATVGAAAGTSESEKGAQPHDPPTFDRKRRASRDAGSLALSLGGPDFNFLGLVNTGWTPPDPHMSVGPSHLVLMTNGAIAFFQKNGTLDFQQDIEGAPGFWGALGTGGFVFDPETCYDPHSNRFVAMACERTGGQGYFLLAISDDADPNGTWFKYRFNVTAQAGGGDIDSPELAVDSQAVYLCADFFTPGDKFLVFIVEKAPILTGGSPITKSLLISGSQSYGVPVTHGTPPAQYMIEALEAPSNTQLKLHAIQNPLGTPTDTVFTLTVPTYQQPEDPPQMGTTSRPEMFESRFWSCVYRNGSLWATHHTGSSRVLQRWYQIDMANWPTSGTPSVVQQGDIDPGAGIRTFMGSIWADSANNAGMVVARSSASEFISIARTYRMAGDALGTMTPGVIVISSTSPETSGRWGDYSCVGDDPAMPGAFWCHQEYRTTTWSTRVALFGPCTPPLTYCTGKVNSLGLTPAIAVAGTNSIGANNLQIQVSNALPNKLGMLLWADNPDSIPFFGGLLCLLSPLTRGPTFTSDNLGFGSVAHPISGPDIGRQRCFQFWLRDPPHVDGTGVGLSNGARMTFCP